MSQSQAPWHHRFVWYDLMTTDAAKSEAFYCGLFGWKIERVPMGPFTYLMIVTEAGPMGGIMEEKAIPGSHWMPYCAVPNVDAYTKRCQELGGSVCVPPTDIPGTGRFAVVGDPTGGTFSLYTGLPESAGFDPNLPVQGAVCWNELLSTDDAAAQRFYSALLGWKEQPKDMGPMGTYRVQELNGVQAGGIMKQPQPGAPSFWMVYFLVADLNAATAKARQLGATVLCESMPIPEVGMFSLITDPAGATSALFQMQTTAPC